MKLLDWLLAATMLVIVIVFVFVVIPAVWHAAPPATQTTLPADMCYVDGLPVIYSLSNGALTYLNTNGLAVEISSSGNRMTWVSKHGCPTQ